MFCRCAVWWLCLVAGTLFAQTTPQTFKLTDGTVIVGRMLPPTDQYIRVAIDGGGGTSTYTNINWGRLSQTTLQELAGNPQAARFANIFLDPPDEPKVAGSGKAPRNLITPPRLDRPQRGGFFASPVMLTVLLLVYAANIYAGFEVGIFRQRPPVLVAAVAAVLPFIGPAIFLVLPEHRHRPAEVPLEAAPLEEAPPEVVEEAPAPVEAQAAPALPAPVVYARGQFTFNRRFFETKFAGFLKMVPGEAERDKVIHIKSARGEHTGQRLSKIEANELYLQVRKGIATEDVMIPFSEVYEVTVKHKDT